MKNKKIFISLLGFAILVAGLYLRFYHAQAVYEPNPNWVNVISLKTATKTKNLQTIGSITAQSVQITPEVSGHVKKILFQDGAFVSAESPLIQLDDAVYQAKFAASKAKLHLAENHYKRVQLLAKKGIVSKQAIDQALADYQGALALAKENEVMLSKMTLRAPFSGMMGQSQINPGAYVSVGQALVSLTDIKHLRVEYTVAENYFPYLKLGQTVSIAPSAYPNQTVNATVAYLSSTINKNNRALSLYADFENKDYLFAPGMFVRVTHWLQTDEKALLIPSRALVPVLDGKQVYKIMDGKAYAVSVRVGDRTQDQVEILEGLSANDLVVTDGQLKLQNGLPVKIKS